MKKLLGPALLLAGVAALTVGALVALQPEPELEPGTVEFTLLLPSGELSTDCRATLYNVLPNGARKMVEDSSGVCDESGRIVWTEREPGPYRLMAATQDVAMLDYSFELGEGPGLRVEPMQFEPGGRLFGVVTQDGEPVSGALVKSSDGAFGQSGKGGKFRIEGVAVGELELRAGKGIYGDVQQVELVEGQTLQVDFQLEAMASQGQIGLLVMDRDGQVVVDQVRPGWPAAEHLRPEDIIESINGVAVRDRPMAKAALAGEPGQAVHIVFRRGEETHQAEIVRRSVDEETE